MVNKDLLATKLAELDGRIARVRARAPESPQALEEDLDSLELIAFNLMLSVQICADIASHIITDERWASAQTLREGFARLREHGVIDMPTEAALKQAVGLRNVVAHGYAGIDVALCHTAATRKLGDLERFAQQVSAWAEQRCKPSE